MVNLYRSGRIAERKVANDLAEKGFEDIGRSAGSRGPADIYAMKDGRKYYIQVKGGSANVSANEIRRLRALARERGGAAVVINRKDSRNRWRFHGNWG